MIVEPNSEQMLLLLEFLKPHCVCEGVVSASEALERISAKSPTVIISNYFVDELSGPEIVNYVSQNSPDSLVMLVADEDSHDLAIEAFRAGAYDFIGKPFELEYIENAVIKAFEKSEARVLRGRYHSDLEDLVADRTSALDRALEDVENSYRVTLKALVQALETRDFETHGHSERVVTFSLRLGFELGLDKDSMRDLELGALLHDIGKIGVPDAILRKPGRLSDREWEKMKLHPVHGSSILRNIPFLEGAARVVSQHHERWDGKGYPEGIKGESIDVGARIFAVIDAYDAMISDRVYRKGRHYEDAVEELERCSGSQFDPLIVEAFKNVPKEHWEILTARSLKEKQEVSSFQAVVEELVRSRGEIELVH